MSDFSAPPTVPETNGGIQNAKDAAVDKTTSAYNTIANHPTTQNIKSSITNSQLANGPVAENVKDQSIKTSNELSALAAARTTPAHPAATGQPLTHYHSFFSSLLSWENPRASAIAYVSIVLFIFGARYLNLMRLALKGIWVVLGIVVTAEIAGKTILGQGLASSMRPKTYYTIPRDFLDAMIGDVHELVNFFVIEGQRLIFADNIFASGAMLFASFIAYYLVKLVPFWGFALISTTVAFIAPLVYTSNQELIDGHIAHASSVVNQQTAQVKNIAAQHASAAVNSTKQYAGDYTAKAQEMISSRGRSTSPAVTTKSPPAYKDADFPAAPKQEFKSTPAVKTENEPLLS